MVVFAGVSESVEVPVGGFVVCELNPFPELGIHFLHPRRHVGDDEVISARQVERDGPCGVWGHPSADGAPWGGGSGVVAAEIAIHAPVTGVVEGGGGFEEGVVTVFQGQCGHFSVGGLKIAGVAEGLHGVCLVALMASSLASIRASDWRMFRMTIESRRMTSSFMRLDC